MCEHAKPGQEASQRGLDPHHPTPHPAVTYLSIPSTLWYTSSGCSIHQLRRSHTMHTRTTSVSTWTAAMDQSGKTRSSARGVWSADAPVLIPGSRSIISIYPKAVASFLEEAPVLPSLDETVMLAFLPVNFSLFLRRPLHFGCFLSMLVRTLEECFVTTCFKTYGYDVIYRGVRRDLLVEK